MPVSPYSLNHNYSLGFLNVCLVDSESSKTMKVKVFDTTF